MKRLLRPYEKQLNDELLAAVLSCRGEARGHLLRPVRTLRENQNRNQNRAKQVKLLLRPYDMKNNYMMNC